MDSQNRMIFEHLKSGKTLTALEALQLYGCLRLASRIHELRDVGRKMGFEIVTFMDEVIGRDGEKKRIGRYSMKPRKEDA